MSERRKPEKLEVDPSGLYERFRVTAGPPGGGSPPPPAPPEGRSSGPAPPPRVTRPTFDVAKLDAVKRFLPVIARANDQLERDMSGRPARNFDIEHVAEGAEAVELTLAVCDAAVVDACLGEAGDAAVVDACLGEAGDGGGGRQTPRANISVVDAKER